MNSRKIRIAAAFACSIALAGCGGTITIPAWLVNDAGTAATQAVATTPIPGQAKTAFGAELTFDFLVKEAQHYVDTGFATPSQKAGIHDAVIKAQAVNVATRTAAQNGSNAAVAGVLAGMNQANLDFAGALAKLGVPVAN